MAWRWSLLLLLVGGAAVAWLTSRDAALPEKMPFALSTEPLEPAPMPAPALAAPGAGQEPTPARLREPAPTADDGLTEFVRSCIGGADMRKVLQRELAAAGQTPSAADLARIQGELVTGTAELMRLYQAGKDGTDPAARWFLAGPGDVFFAFLPELAPRCLAGGIEVRTSRRESERPELNFDYDVEGDELRALARTRSWCFEFALRRGEVAPWLWDSLESHRSVLRRALSRGADGGGNR